MSLRVNGFAPRDERNCARAVMTGPAQQSILFSYAVRRIASLETIADRVLRHARAGHTQGICTRISHRTHTDWLRADGASITTSLAAGGRAFVHHDECYHWRPRGPDS